MRTGSAGWRLGLGKLDLVILVIGQVSDQFTKVLYSLSSIQNIFMSSAQCLGKSSLAIFHMVSSCKPGNHCFPQLPPTGKVNLNKFSVFHVLCDPLANVSGSHLSLSSFACGHSLTLFSKKGNVREIGLIFSLMLFPLSSFILHPSFIQTFIEKISTGTFHFNVKNRQKVNLLA